eukprot:925879-Prymnesium_polylepis.1
MSSSARAVEPNAGCATARRWREPRAEFGRADDHGGCARLQRCTIPPWAHGGGGPAAGKAA